jgi:hypothetical protein
MADNFLEEKLKELGAGVDSVHTGELRANEQGEIILSGKRGESSGDPVAYRKSGSDQAFAVEHVVVEAGQQLVIRPEAGIAHVVIGELEVEPGGQVRVEAPTTLHIGILQSPEASGEELYAEAGNKMVFSFVGADGPAGALGQPGPTGPSGPQGGQGGTGGNGGGGGDGLNGVTSTVNIGYVNVEALFNIRGGNGGAGGRGGTGGQGGSGWPGGRGGQGGNGGPGGNGGNGAVVTVNYTKVGPQGYFTIGEYQATGGDPGQAGDGGPGGPGNPPGQTGPKGSKGTRGKDGEPGKLVLNPNSSA